MSAWVLKGGFSANGSSLSKLMCWPIYLQIWLKKQLMLQAFYSSFASTDFCQLLINFANSLEPVQDRQIVGLDLDPNSLTL